MVAAIYHSLPDSNRIRFGIYRSHFSNVVWSPKKYIGKIMTHIESARRKIDGLFRII